MTLILTAVCAIIAIIIRFAKPDFGIRYRFGVLALIYSGAALMWSIDGIASMIGGEAFVELTDSAAVWDDTKLGLCVIVLGLAVWAIMNMVKSRGSNLDRA